MRESETSQADGSRQWRVRGLVLALPWAIVAIGASLRLWQYLKNPALFTDEIALARNIFDRSLWNVISLPVAYDQAAPKGFLLIEKLLVLTLGPSDYVLRLFPLISSLVALLLFGRVAAQMLEGIARYVALLLFATAGPVVLFATTVKQYSSDVTVSIAFLWLALYCRTSPMSRRQAAIAGIVGAVCVWFSTPAVLTLIAPAGIVALKLWSPRGTASSRQSRTLVWLLVLWGLSAATATVVSLQSMTPSTREFMRSYWAEGFPPAPLGAVKTLWPLRQMRLLFGNGSEASLGYPFSTVYVALALLGAGILWRRGRDLAILLTAPIVATLVAATVHQYPFSSRLVLFLLPNLLLAVAASAELLRPPFTSARGIVGTLTLCVLLGPALYRTITAPPPYWIEDIKPALAYFQSIRQPHDQVYVFFGAVPAVIFYSAQYGLRDGEYLAGACHDGEDRRYFQEVDRFRGVPRLWVLIAKGWASPLEKSEVLRYLNAVGRRVDGISIESHTVSHTQRSAEALLFDLSDPTRLSSASSDTFPLRRRQHPDSCSQASKDLLVSKF